MDPLVISLVWIAMISSGIWESSVEGIRPWAKGKIGWKIGHGRWILTRYHFFLFWVTFPILLSIPLVVSYSPELLRTLIFAYSTGVILQDISWFMFNPRWSLRRFTPSYVDWYAWVRIGRFHIPLMYIVGILIAIAMLI